jgi:phospholipase C
MSNPKLQRTAWHTAICAALAGTFAGSVAHADEDFPTRTPIKHIVAIFQENVSFDHYFGTYPHAAANKDGSVYFGHVRPDTPRVNGLESSGLVTNNPNGVNPFRIDRSVPLTCDQDHGYGDEQFAFHGGLMDQFLVHSCSDPVLGTASTLGYYDGNTVTALWNYAQRFAMSDNSYSTTFGPSTPGLLNFVAGTTFAGTITNGLSGKGFIANAANSGAVIGDADPANDICSNPKRTQVLMSGRNVGDLLNAAGITWGAFMGGFGDTTCAQTHTNIGGASVADYIPHHAFFQYWASTQNPKHMPPSSIANIGKTDQANHQYDLSMFFKALQSGHLPAVSILKAAAYQDGHAGYSDPLDEQTFLVDTINAIMQSPEWRETAVIILYDDSDGWYDHQMGPIVSQSNVAEDQLAGSGSCGAPKATQPGGTAQNGRCGYGPRQPFLVLSPWAKSNYVDHRITDQASVVRFIEDNWGLPRIGGGAADAVAGTLGGFFDFDGRPEFSRPFLDPTTGQFAQGDDDR